MKRVWWHVLAGAGAVAAGIAVTAACVHDDSSMFVYDVLAPQLVANGAICLFTSDPTQPFESSGTLDLSLTDHYDGEFLVANQLVQEGNANQFMTETSRINVQGAIVRITDSSGNQLKTYSRLTAGTIQPSTGTTPGYAPFGVTIVDHDTATGLAGQVGGGTSIVRVITYTRFYGRTLGGQYIESNEFEFPVDVCSGCLVGVLPADLTGMANSSMLPLPCIPGQDVVIDCSQCTAEICALKCGAVIPDAGGG